VCSIAEYFYELYYILTSPQGESLCKQRVKNTQRYHTKTYNKIFIIQPLRATFLVKKTVKTHNVWQIFAWHARGKTVIGYGNVSLSNQFVNDFIFESGSQNRTHLTVLQVQKWLFFCSMKTMTGISQKS